MVGRLRTTWQRLTYRRLDLGPLLDTFLVSAIVCMLLIRLILHLTNYPQLGNSTLHVAHMLWGGMGLTLAIIVLLAFPTRVAAHVAAFVGGLGFGAFIDELGKFITQDNDYFFAPTIGIVYVIFILMYLGFRQLEGATKPSPTTDLINAIELTKEAALRAMDASERARALELLGRCDQHDVLVRGLTETLTAYDALDTEPPGPLARLKGWLVGAYKRLIQWRWFAYAFMAAAAVISLGNLVYAFIALRDTTIDKLGFKDWGELISSVVSGLLVLAAVLVWRRSRLRAYRLSDAAVLIAIFFTQFFRFLTEELAAVGGLAFALVLHGVLRYVIDQETAVQAERAALTLRSSAPPIDEPPPAG